MISMFIQGSGRVIRMERFFFFKIYTTHAKSDYFLEPLWLTKSSGTDVQIYLNPGLIDLIKNSFFNNPTAFGYKYRDYYVSSHPDRKEPELTIPIVALSATVTAVGISFCYWIIIDCYGFSSLQCYGNGIMEKRRNLVPRARVKNSKVKFSKGFTIDMWKLWHCWRRRSTHTIISCQPSIPKSRKSFQVLIRLFLIVFMHIHRDGDNQRDTGSLVKGNALAVLDLAGLD